MGAHLSEARVPSRAAQVIVVGAGPGGASTAFHLAKDGVDVLLLDRASFPRDKVCAEYLSPQASRIIAAMGAMEAVDASGPAHLTGMRVRAPNGYEIHGSFAAHHGFRAFRDRGIAVRRSVLDAILVARAQAAGARLSERSRITDVLRDGFGRTCGVAVLDDDGATRELHAPLVIGADGLRSVVGRRLGLTRVSRFPRRVALVAHYRNVAGVNEVGEMHVERDGYVGIADVGHGLTNVALVVPARVMRERGSDPSAMLDEWLAQHPHLAARFAGAARVEAVRATGPFASSTRNAWSPGAALVGDAADFFDPFTGEGVYSALRGGELLAPFAAEAATLSPGKSATALAAYDAARRAEFGGKWLVERLIAGTVAVPALINHAARALSRRKEMADLLVGVAGDFVPASEVLRAGYFARLLVFGV
ncbi:MAG: NAD(P)/FAD-dependent oxidoreductase [Gemmatimonadota bacterium]|nr:NAD(P)/FAD-dependent oxidoreductase [Gemmatimonadota bacterium]